MEEITAKEGQNIKQEEKKEENKEVKQEEKKELKKDKKKECKQVKKKDKNKKEEKGEKETKDLLDERNTALQNIEKKKSNKEINYRQSFKIMEIAKQLEREITKQDFEDKKDNEIKKENNDNNNNLNYRDSISIDIISNKPIDNKKKKKQRISFIE